MSLCYDGLDAKLKNISVNTLVKSKEPIIRLANALDWRHMAEIALPDLKKTEKMLWWLGRSLYLRIHLAVMILHCILKETDRGIEKRINETPLLKVFCGYGVIVDWFCPDHTKIEKFRNRLSPDTHKKICHYVIQIAVELGFADPSWMDLDSTVQEAGIAYPSDAHLMRKLAQKCTKVLSYFQKKAKKYLPQDMRIDMALINKKAKEYFFLAKNTAIEKKREIFQSYHQIVKQQLKPMIKFCENLDSQILAQLPWNICRDIDQISQYGWQLLLDIAHFIRTNSIKPGKILSFYLFCISCIKKGKLGKEKEFGRVFQIGRIGGNFMIPFTCTDIRMEDKHSVIPAIKEHRDIFGEDVLQNIATDKGYYSKDNISDVQKIGINTDGMQRPGHVKDQLDDKQVRPLINRRAGIEPLIGHVKEFGLKKSKMKTDYAALSSGYQSVLGFNLHQLMRNLGNSEVRTNISAC